jgi:hypothetical protein
VDGVAQRVVWLGLGLLCYAVLCCPVCCAVLCCGMEWKLKWNGMEWIGTGRGISEI